MTVLVIAEHDNNEFKPANYNTLAAAAQLGTEIEVLVAGAGCRAVADAAAAVPGVGRVLLADCPACEHALAENVAPLVAGLAKDYSHVMVPATTTGKNLMPRIAGLLQMSQVSDIISVESEDSFKRPMYAGNIIATVRCADAIKLITVRGTAFDPLPAEGGNASVEALPEVSDSGLSAFVGEELSKSERPELTSAGIIISGGRGMGSGENFQLLETIADKLGAAIGASRAAVDAGFVPNDMQVGQTGKIVAPELYIAVGISGAIQHLAGMKDSKVIVAINKDEEAPIFQVADYGLTADLFEALPALEALL